MPKLHHHESQLDEHRYARCGRVPADHPSILLDAAFEAADPSQRCRICDRDWFPYGQPAWHLEQAQRAAAFSTPTKDTQP